MKRLWQMGVKGSNYYKKGLEKNPSIAWVNYKQQSYRQNFQLLKFSRAKPTCSAHTMQEGRYPVKLNQK